MTVFSDFAGLTNARACVILINMKKLIATLLLLSVLCLLTAGLFGCKEETHSVDSQAVLAEECVNAILPEGEDNAALAATLLSFFQEAQLEQAEIRSLLLTFKEKGSDIAVALQSLKDNSYREEDFSVYRSVLQTVANTISPEVAGSVFYTAASRLSIDLPYSREDCKKIASLFLGQDAAFGSGTFDRILSGEYTTTDEKQLNTALYSLASSLRAAIGISASARERLRSLFATLIEQNFADEELQTELQETLLEGKSLFLSLSNLLISHLDVVLTYAADYLAASDAKILLGFPYEKQERTLYYGYNYASWEPVLISEEDYNEKAGGYDEYLSERRVVKGFTVNGEYLIVENEDAILANRVLRLYTAVRTYDALSADQKEEIRTLIEGALAILSENREVLEEVSFDQMIAALRNLSSFDVTDGVTDEEHTSADIAVTIFERYLHPYLPELY